MFQWASHLASDLSNLLFPQLCGACGQPLYRGECAICHKCMLDMPFTDFHLHPENRVAQQLWNRLPLNGAMSMLYFNKGAKVQQLLHQLKYNGKTDVGLMLGKMLGQRLQQSSTYQSIDMVIPVPLHPKKQEFRGYNQSSFIAQGVAEVMHIQVLEGCLLRNKITDSQTKKSRYNRFENMLDVFTVKDVRQIEGKHVLLVDDVITTGATIEACGNALMGSNIAKLSVAGLAFAV